MVRVFSAIVTETRRYEGIIFEGETRSVAAVIKADGQEYLKDVLIRIDDDAIISVDVIHEVNVEVD